jgi:hypothetical protein
MGSTNNLELEQMAKYFKLPLVCVIQKDELYQYNHINNGFYVINNESSSDGNGSHWTCLFLNNNTSFFFCSFGSPPSEEIIRYVKRFSKHMKHNNFIIQDQKSDNCGYYCIGFILFLYHNSYNSLEYIKAFDDNTKRNDLVLEGIIRLYIKTKPPRSLNRFLTMKY